MECLAIKQKFAIILCFAFLHLAIRPVQARPAVGSTRPLTAAQSLVTYLEAQGVTKIFGVPGEETLDLVDAIRASKKIQFINTGNEQGASFMATGYARATGKIGVALSTLGPGATNLVTGTANALSENIKLLLITGQGPVRRPFGYHQKLALTRILQPVTRLSLEATDPNKVVSMTQKLIDAALKKPGPVHLSLPADVAHRAVTHPQVVKPRRVPWIKRPPPSRRAVERAVNIIQKCTKPVIIAGDGVLQERSDHTARGILAFAEAHQIPIIPSTIAKGMFPTEHPLVLPALDPFAKGKGGDLIRQADLIISIGYHPMEIFDPQTFNPGNQAKLIQISTQKFPRQHRVTGWKPELQITSGLVKSIGAIHRKMRGYRAPKAITQAAGKIKIAHAHQYQQQLDQAGHAPLKPQRVIGELRRAMDEIINDANDNHGKNKVMVFGDVGLNKSFMTQWLPIKHRKEVMMPNGISTMGVSLPAAIGAKLARPELKVISVSGDGGFMMNMQELAVAAKHHLPLVHIMFIDKRLGLIENHQRRNNFSTAGVNLPTIDVPSLAKGMGARGYVVQDAQQIAPLIRQGLARHQPTLIGIPVDYSDAHAAADRSGAQRLKKHLPSPHKPRFLKRIWSSIKGL